MQKHFRCSSGHHWEVSIHSQAGAPLPWVVCPQCGAAAETIAPPATASETGTLSYSHLETDLPARAFERPLVSGYEILEELGRGGMGVVYKARQLSLNRIVALKMILAGAHAGTEDLARFRAEAFAVARLHHPNIVQIFEVGDQDGLPYIALEYVGAGHMGQHLNGTPQPPRAAAQLVETLAHAMQAAHEAGLVHRDLKPANILLSRIEDRGSKIEDRADKPDRQSSILDPRSSTPKITDFGLAKDLAVEQGQTRTGAVVGTPSYMAPEQAAGKSREIGPATDVYALGTILYECLTGRPPYKGATPLETLEQVRRAEPVPPSRLTPHLPRDLETICLKCLREEPTRRYASARDLANDLRCFLDGRPVHARPVGPAGRVWSWCRRRPAAAVLAAVAAVLVFVVLPLGVWYQLSLTEARRAEQVAGELADAARKAEVSAREAGATHEYYALLNSVRARNTSARPGWTWEALADLERAAALPTPYRDQAELRTEAATCLATVDLRLQAVLAPSFSAGAMALSPDGHTLAVTQSKAPGGLLPCTVLLLDPAGCRPRRSLFFPTALIWEKAGPVQDGGWSCCFSPDGRMLFVGTRGGWIYRWDLTREPAERSGWKAHEKAIIGLGVSHDGSFLFTGADDQTVKRWDLVSQKEVAPHWEAPDSLFALEVGNHGGPLVCARGQKVVELLDPITLKPYRAAVAQHDTQALDISPDGTTALSAQSGGVVLVDLGDGTDWRYWHEAEEAWAHEGRTSVVRFHPGSTLFVTASDVDRKVKLWELATSRVLARLSVAGSGPIRAAFTPEGDGLIVAGDDQVIRYELGGLHEQVLMGSQKPSLLATGFTPDGRSLVCVPQSFDSPDGKLCSFVALYNTTTNKEECGHFFPMPLDGEPILALNPRSSQLALGGRCTEPVLWDYRRDTPTTIVPARGAQRLCFSGDGSSLWGVVEGDTVHAWNSATGRLRTQWKNERSLVMTGLSGIYSLAAGKEWAVAGGRDGWVRLLRMQDGQPAKTWAGPRGPVWAVALSADESLAAVGTQEGAVRVLRVPSGEVVADLEGHRDRVQAAAFRGDGRLLATGSLDRTVRLYQRFGDTFRLILTLRFPTGPVTEVAFHPDGNLLGVHIRNEATVRVWRLDRLRERLAQLHLGDDDW
jgi:WD40 repeat protein